MKIHRLKNDRLYGIIFMIVLSCLSLGTSFILFQVLDSIAEVKSKSISLGGAAAGFYIIFKLLEKSYYKVFAQESKLLIDIEELKKENKRLLLKIGQLTKIKVDCPDNYISEISSDLKFGFAYPDYWHFAKSKFIDYCFVVEKPENNKGKTNDIVTNFSVVYIDTSEIENDIEEISEIHIKDELYETPNSKIIEKADNFINGIKVKKTTILWIDDKRNEFIGYLNLFLDEANQRIIKVTCTSLKHEFEMKKETFDNILNTFRINHMA